MGEDKKVQARTAEEGQSLPLFDADEALCGCLRSCLSGDAVANVYQWKELARRQHRLSSSTDELRSELKSLQTLKLSRAEAEALVAGALADWTRAAQAGADAVQGAVSRGKTLREEASFTSFNDSYFFSAEEAARSPVPWTTQAAVSDTQPIASRWAFRSQKGGQLPGQGPTAKPAANGSPADRRRRAGRARSFSRT
ncbi:unnamed protein product [Effrenium voratum]|nr:unnamed protein product [Effrenium voratum]